MTKAIKARNISNHLDLVLYLDLLFEELLGHLTVSANERALFSQVTKTMCFCLQTVGKKGG